MRNFYELRLLILCVGFITPDDGCTLYVTEGQAVEKKEFDLQGALAEEFCVNRILFCINL